MIVKFYESFVDPILVRERLRCPQTKVGISLGPNKQLSCQTLMRRGLAGIVTIAKQIT